MTRSGITNGCHGQRIAAATVGRAECAWGFEARVDARTDDSAQRRFAPLSAAPILLAFSLFLAGCETQTIIYKDVPEYQLRQGIVQERVVLEDGTILIHRPRQFDAAATGANAGAAGEGEAGAEGAAGPTTSLMPEQVFMQLLLALRDGEYQNVWDHVLSSQVKERYGEGNAGFDEFTAYMERNRDDLYSMLNRLNISLYSPEVIQEPGPLGGLRYRFHRTVADQFKFAAVDLVYEDYGLKLFAIHPR